MGPQGRPAQPPQPRRRAALNGYFYVIGGQHGQEAEPGLSIRGGPLQPRSDTWTKVASLPSPRSHITQDTLVYQGRILIVGGGTASGTPQLTIYDYDPRTKPRGALGTSPTARSTSVCGIVGNMLLVSTGNSPGPTTTTWIGTMT